MEEIVNIHDAKSRLSKLIVQIENGKTVIIARAGRPVARLVPYTQPKKAVTLGTLRGAFEFDLTAFADADAEIASVFGAEADDANDRSAP